MRPLQAGVAALWIGVFSGAALAARDVRVPEARQDEIDPPAVVERSVPLDPAGSSAAARGARDFVRRHGGEWRFRSDPRTGRLVLAQGSGIALPTTLKAAAVEPWVREFLAEQRPGLGPDRGALVFDAARSLVRDAGRSISLYYAWHVDGVPVDGALAFARIRAGRLTQFGARWIAPLDTETTPAIDAREAARRLMAHTGDTLSARWRGAPELALEPVADDGAGRLGYRLVWKLRYDRPGDPATWEGRVDATTGEVAAFRDVNRYGRAVGGVYVRSWLDGGEVVAPLPRLGIQSEGQRWITDAGGRFPYTGGPLRSGLDGFWVRTNCVDCVGPEQADVRVAFGDGVVDFGLGGSDALGNGRSTPSERNAFYHLNRIREVALSWLPELAWLRTAGVPVEVNLPYNCNAYWDGTAIHMFRAGSGCANTGEIADLLRHEWAHALDDATLPDDGSTGEGAADVAAMQLSHSALVAPGVFVDGGALRDLDWRTSPLGRLTLSRVAAGACARPQGGLSYHCVGQLFGQAAWDLAQALGARYGTWTGWRESERLFFGSLPDAGNLDPQSAVSIYAAYLQADDDDGNLANGTPHAAEIHAAFAAHEIALDALPSSPVCARPAQPRLSVVSRCDSFDLAWDAVRGARRYEVLRAELRADTAFVRVGSVKAPGLGFVDELVIPGVDYWYVVLAVDAAGCESAVDRTVAARLPQQPDGNRGYVCGAAAARGQRGEADVPPDAEGRAGPLLRSATGATARPRIRRFSASTNTEKAIAK